MAVVGRPLLQKPFPAVAVAGHFSKSVRSGAPGRPSEARQQSAKDRVLVLILGGAAVLTRTILSKPGAGPSCLRWRGSGDRNVENREKDRFAETPSEAPVPDNSPPDSG